MTWPFNAEPGHGALPPLPHGVALPAEFNIDYGVPLEVCHEEQLPDNRGSIFRRQWSRAQVALDCNTFQATIAIIGEEEEYNLKSTV